ncbi:hypothetical protein [Flavobacterium sp.]|uniref:DMP19 family protein n=1 Tax=Flavobacterium sp. TaxID=239 RepID=UPI0039E27776
MSNTQLLKIAIVLLALSAYAYRWYSRRKKSNTENEADADQETPTFFFSLNDGNQTEVIVAPKYDPEWFKALDEKYSWDRFDEYDNRFWEYMYQLFDTLPDLAETENRIDFFNNLNRPQKVFYSLLVFNGDTDNGGVAQFFFNRPEFVFAVLETFDELKLPQLKADYEKCLNEFLGTSESYLKRKQIFNDQNLDWEKRWKAFVKGYDEIKSAAILEDYYYTTEFRKDYYKNFVDYADRHMDYFVKK